MPRRVEWMHANCTSGHGHWFLLYFLRLGLASVADLPLQLGVLLDTKKRRAAVPSHIPEEGASLRYVLKNCVDIREPPKKASSRLKMFEVTLTQLPPASGSVHINLLEATLFSTGFCHVHIGHLSVCLSVYLSVCLSICLPIYLYVCISIYLYLSIYMSVYLSIYLSIYLSTYLYVCISICLS